MTLLEGYTISGRGIQVPSIPWSGANAEIVAWGHFDRPREASAGAWNRLRNTLLEWGRNPSSLEDDGIRPPSLQVVSRALVFMTGFREAGWSPFDRVVTTGDGGIAFQIDSGSEFMSFEIDADGTLEFFQFIDSNLVTRKSIAPPFDVDG